MKQQVMELCRQLKPVLGRKVDRLWLAYLAESDMKGKADIEQTLELLAAKHLKKDYHPDRSPFPPPERKIATAGNIGLGKVIYAGKELYPFALKKDRLKEHILIAGRSGSGKTNLAFVLMQNLINNRIKVLALDWKRSYRNMIKLQKDLRVYTIGRKVAPFRFNPLIPPEGCEPDMWIKLIVDIIAGAYLGGEGVISLLISGLDYLYREAGVYDETLRKWPTIMDLLVWLKKAKLKGRAAMWQASAERILLAMTYGEFGKVLNARDNSHVAELLDYNVVLEMDGLASDSDRTMFSGALTLYLYRYRLAKGYQKKLTNMIFLEEAHNLLLKKSLESKESVLETSIRMVREYGLGYVSIDQMPHKLSTVAFANSYAIIALSQKLRNDVSTIAGAMNLTEEQKEAINTLPIGTAVVRLSDEHTEPFLVKIPLCPIQDNPVTDMMIRKQWDSCHSNSTHNNSQDNISKVIPAVPAADKNRNENITEKTEDSTHPPSPIGTDKQKNLSAYTNTSPPSNKPISTEAKRFVTDIIAHPLSTTVLRYHRLHLSRRRGDAVRRFLVENALIEPVRIATRTGQVVLFQLTYAGWITCNDLELNPAAKQQESLEHRYWVGLAANYYKEQGYEIDFEYAVKGNGMIDILAKKSGKQIAIEIETGKSNILVNLKNAIKAPVDKLVFIATSPAAVSTCQNIIEKAEKVSVPVELLTWLDIS